MKSVLYLGFACCLAFAGPGCASAAPTSTVATTSAPVKMTGGASFSRRALHEGSASSLRTRAAYKTRCESGDDSACLVAGTFER